METRGRKSPQLDKRVKMKRQIELLGKENFDIAVIGGGIIGTGIARDASLRGIKTVLIEKDDFASGTTSRSSRLIHGGLRYLQQMEFHLVRQDLHEREILLNIADHLVKPYPFIIPMDSLYCNVFIRIGVPLYDLMSFDKSIPSRKYLTKQEAVSMAPELANLKGLTGAFIYYDCQAPYTERLAIENVISSAENGAVMVNHAGLAGFIRDGSNINGIKVQDSITGETYDIKTKLVVNAAGHWVDCVRDLMHDRPESTVRRTKGIHLVMPKLCERALVLFSDIDNRLFFILPWLEYTLIGSTDTDYHGDLDKVAANKADVDYMLKSARQVFPDLNMGDIYYSTAGLRPLAHIGGEKPSQVTREHKILDHKVRDGIEGMITVLGGKITAHRAVAQDAVDMVCRKLGINTKCVSAHTPLPGAPSVSKQTIEQTARESGLNIKTLNHLADIYGSRFDAVVKLAKENKKYAEPLCSHSDDIMAQVAYAIEQESALTISDFLLRRGSAGLSSCQGLDAVYKVADEMGRILKWGIEEKQAQIGEYKATVALSQEFRSLHNK
jgi:glycerol-3-phosphate dehydrogenase